MNYEWPDDKSERHLLWKLRNMETLNNSGLTFKVTSQGETVLFREREKPMIDFYPSTGRWRIVGRHPKTFRGGAKAFIHWYKAQQKGFDNMQRDKHDRQETAETVVDQPADTANPQEHQDPAPQDGRPTDGVTEDTSGERPWHERQQPRDINDE